MYYLLTVVHKVALNGEQKKCVIIIRFDFLYFFKKLMNYNQFFIGVIVLIVRTEHLRLWRSTA